MNQIDTVMHLCARRPGEGLAHAEKLLILLNSVNIHDVFDTRHSKSTHHLLIQPLQLHRELVIKLLNQVSNRLPLVRRVHPTILKCTGGPPNEVKPMCQFCRTVLPSLSTGTHPRS